jgi:3-oxoacyl-[acyl-carrier-protein] synthase II
MPPAQDRTVYVTGTGLLVGDHASPCSLWEAVVAGTVSSRRVEADPAEGLSPGDASILSRHQLLALSAVDRAWRSAGLPSDFNRLRGEGDKIRRARFACVGGSSLGGLVAMEEDCASVGEGKFSPYALGSWRGNAVPSVVALRFGLGGTVLSLNAASATGSQILCMAGTLIRGGAADVVVAVAADTLPSPELAAAMSRNGSVARKTDSIPLSGARSGMTPAEGAACLILESAGHAVARGASPLAEWIGGESANESYHLQAPDPRGATLEGLIRKVSEGYGIDWVSLHATGTRRYDAVEAAVLGRVFPGTFPWISGFKRHAGHTLSASGLIEVSLLVEGLRRGMVAPWPGEMDPTLGFPTVPPTASPVPRTALQLGQGMGGDVVVNLLGSVATVA